MRKKKKEILIVDDQPGIRLLLGDILMSKGYSVSLAEDGKQALNKIAERDFDVIILDYRLPIISGEQVLKQLDDDNIKTPVILMSGLSEILLNEAEKYEFPIEILAKPFDIEVMYQIVERIIETKEAG